MTEKKQVDSQRVTILVTILDS